MAQFPELATTDDGGQVYFTSALRLGDPAEPAWPESRLYRHAGAVGLFAERGEPVTTGSSSSGGVQDASVSGDGGTVAFSVIDPCPPSEPCTRPIQQARIRSPGGVTVLGEGIPLLSRNGRWALLLPPRILIGPPRPPALVELETGTRVEVASLAFRDIPPAADGSVFVPIPRPGAPPGYGLWRDGQVTAVDMPRAIRPIALTPDARVVVFNRFVSPPPPTLAVELVAMELASGRETVLDGTALPAFMGLSNDGRWLLYRTTTLTSRAGNAKLLDIDSGQSVDLSPDGELVASGVLSGLGNAAILVTVSGRIVRFNLVDGKPTGLDTLAPATPYVARGSFTSAGSRDRLAGSLPRDAALLSGRILLGGIAMPIIEVSPSEVIAQVPWEARTPASLIVDLPSESPFRQKDLVLVSNLLPRFEPFFRFIGEDFSGVLTRPPRAGEVVHLYLSGLGPVNGAIATGEPAPLDRPLSIQGQFRCQFAPHGAYSDTLFAGLAPGTIGLYQVTLRMPPSAGAPVTGGRCDTASGTLTFSVAPVSP